MAEDKPATSQEQKPASKISLKVILLIVGVLLLEGATISIFTVFGGEGQPADHTNPIEGTSETQPDVMAEVLLADSFTVDNYVGGRTRLVVTMEVSAKVKKDQQEKLQKLVDSHQTEIKDSIRTLISSSQPDEIRDPKLQVLKREIKNGVETIIGSGLIEEILMPHWQAISTD
jgi:flagellar basal body-associated protein FliL